MSGKIISRLLVVPLCQNKIGALLSYYQTFCASGRRKERSKSVVLLTDRSTVLFENICIYFIIVKISLHIDKMTELLTESNRRDCQKMFSVTALG